MPWPPLSVRTSIVVAYLMWVEVDDYVRRAISVSKTFPVIVEVFLEKTAEGTGDVSEALQNVGNRNIARQSYAQRLLNTEPGNSSRR